MEQINYYEIFKVTVIIIIIICAILIIFKKEVKQYFNEGFETTSAPTANTNAPSANEDTTTTTTTTAQLLPEIDFQNLKLNFSVGGYIPMLDLIITRLILWNIWNNEISNKQTTPVANNQPATSERYTTKYKTFWEFFAFEMEKVPRLNIFIQKNNTTGTSASNTSPTTMQTMHILITKFKKPDWMIQLGKFFFTPKIDGKTAYDYVEEIMTKTPEDRESNTSNTFNDNDLANLNLFTMPTVMREKFEEACKKVLEINLKKTDEKNKQFNESTLQLLKFFSDKYPVLTMQYIKTEDPNTQELLGLTKDDLYDNKNLMKPSIVKENYARDKATFASILGYPNETGKRYTLNLITDGDKVLGEHTNNIKLLAKRAFMQNVQIGEFTPDELIDDELKSITDNIYSYYFNIFVKKNVMTKRGQRTIRQPSPEDKNRVFGKINKYKLPVYLGLPNLFQNESITKGKLDSLTKMKPTTDEEKKKQEVEIAKLRAQLKYLQKTRYTYEVTMPYIIYLPIYDFQYIKIIPKFNKSDLYAPQMSSSINYRL